MILSLAIELTIYPRNNQNLLILSKLTLEQNNEVMKKLNLFQ